MAILITGGTGFIGSALAKALLRKGKLVHVFGFPQPGSARQYHPNLTVHHGDIRSERDVMQAMSGCSHVYHLAACACPWLPRNDDFFDVNVRGTDTLLACAKRSGIERVVVTSTNLTIGPSHGTDITEETVRTTDFYTTYERSKVAADLVTSGYVRNGLSVVTVHPTRVFGPGPISEANSVTKMILWYLRGSWRFIPGSGNAIGNYVYLEDLLEGYLRAMGQGKDGEHYILGGENISYNDLFELITDVSGISRRMVRLPSPVALSIALAQKMAADLTGMRPLLTPGWTRVFLEDWNTSCTKAVTQLGYRITPLRSALVDVIKWFGRAGHFTYGSVQQHVQGMGR